MCVQIGCPTWKSRLAPATPNLFTIFGFSLDSGTDNIGAVKRIASLAEGGEHIAIISAFCFLHQYHLVAKSFLLQLDAFKFTGDPEKTTYVSAVATIANVWRSPGVANMLRSKAAQLFGDGVAAHVCGKTPGRAIRTRWGSLNSVEMIIIKGAAYLATLFAETFGETKEKRHTAFGLLSEMEDESRERLKAYRAIAVRLLHSPFFVAKVFVSSICQRPLTHFMMWVQKMHGDEHKLLKSNSAFHPTMLAELVQHKAADIEGEISQMLGESASQDERSWGPVWKMLPFEHFHEVRALIILLVVHSACQWDMRVSQKVGSFPFLLLACLAEGPQVKSELRQMIAARLLGLRRCCLKTPFSDLALKLRSRYRQSFQVMERDGTCPRHLHVLLHMVACVLRGDTQKVEGANSTLQQICKAAPNIHLPLCSDRLAIKTGLRLDAETCSRAHQDVLALKDQELFHDRFNAELSVASVPRALAPMGDGYI